MSATLTNNFLLHARSITFKDTASVTWSLNANTNQLTATSGGGTVGSVGLADGSTTALYTISGSPVTGSGTLTFTLKTQTANFVLAGPSTGSAAQPTFRALAVADLPTGYPYGDLSGAPAIPAGANPSASIGLAASNGVSTSFMRADAAPALSQSINPTWTAAHNFAPSSGSAVPVTVTLTQNGTDAVELVGGAAISAWVHISAGSQNAYLGLSGGTGNVITGSATGDLCLRNSSNIDFSANGGASIQLQLTSTGLALTGKFGWNGATPPAQVTGFGTPTGAAVVANFSGTAATTSQIQETIAQILTIMKAHGMIGA